MSDDPLMQDLRTVTDETLYLRLTLLAHRFPTDYKELDYEYRRDLWETVNKAIRAEIRRRKAEPPAWWNPAAREETPPRRHRYAAGYLASIAAAGLLVTVPALTPLVLLAALGCGAAWLLPHMRDTGFRRTPRR